MPVATNSLIAFAAGCLLQAPSSQEPIPVAYPEKDALSPFRDPTDIYAPPDELFRQLGVMQNIANRPGVEKSYDERGREVVDDPTWREAFAKVKSIGIDAGILAGMMRLHRNAVQRETAFYGAFYAPNIGHVMELISHIPGEPVRATREAAFPRAIAFLRANLKRKFGQLSEDEKAAVLKALPEIGSPVAKAQGVSRLPTDGDHLHSLTLKPFFQLLDLEEDIDRAQALWFLKEVFTIRPDLPNLWLEPALPRLEQLLVSKDPDVRNQTIAIYQLVGPKKMGPPPSDPEALVTWARAAAKHLFPPIRNLNDAIVQLFPSEERDAIAEAGTKALQSSAIGDPFRGQRKDGSWFSGFRVARIPEELAPLAIPVDATITSVNGTPIGSAQDLLATVSIIVKKKAKRRQMARVMIEYVLKGKAYAIEYRIM